MFNIDQVSCRMCLMGEREIVGEGGGVVIVLTTGQEVVYVTNRDGSATADQG